jgi:hypothetical protein
MSYVHILSNVTHLSLQIIHILLQDEASKCGAYSELETPLILHMKAFPLYTSEVYRITIFTQESTDYSEECLNVN